MLYYVGPTGGSSGKWRQRWTGGPWRIHQRCGKFGVTIIDATEKTKDASIDRLKVFKASDGKDYHNYNEYLKLLKRSTNFDPVFP